MNGPLSPALSAHFSRLTDCLPPPWSASRQGRAFLWAGQAFGDPAPRRYAIRLDERAAIQLGADTHHRSHEHWRRPVNQRQLMAYVNEWAACRAAQWQSLVKELPLAAEDQASLQRALQRHESCQCMALADRIWRSSLHRRLEHRQAAKPNDQVLLRWVLNARTAEAFKRRRSLARHHQNLLVLAASQLHRSSLKWPWCLRQLSEESLPRWVSHLKLPSWARRRIVSRELRDSFKDMPADDAFIAWSRLCAQLPKDIWPTRADELQAAEAVLAHLAPLFSFGLGVADAHDLKGDPKRLRSILRQLHQEHGGSWRYLLCALRSDHPFNALMDGTAQRLREVLAIVHEHDADALARATEALRSWPTGRWRAALLDWQLLTLAGCRGAVVQWKGLLEKPVMAGRYRLRAPTHWTSLRELLIALDAEALGSALTDVFRGAAQFVEVRAVEPDALVALALIKTQAGELAVGADDWPRETAIHFAPGLPLAAQKTVRLALADAIEQGIGFDWGLLHWRQNWACALLDPVLAKALARSFMRAWMATKK